MTKIDVVIIVTMGVFILYRRIRRALVRQKVRPWLHYIVAMFLATGCVRLIIAVAMNSTLVPGVLLGTILGVALGWFGLRNTTFSREKDGVTYYRPNPYIGMTILAILAGWLTWRITTVRELLETSHDLAVNPNDLSVHLMSMKTPWSLLVPALLLLYYSVFSIGVLVRMKTPTEGTLMLSDGKEDTLTRSNKWDAGDA